LFDVLIEQEIESQFKSQNKEENMQKVALKEDIKTTRSLLTAGVIAGILFILVPLFEMFIRPGFDLKRHAISVLSLGDLGWIQITTFEVTGMLNIACAIGMRRVMVSGPGGTWGPLLIGVYGIGMIAAGIFSTDPGFGFPPGAPEGMPASMSWHAILHSVAFFLAFTSLTVACFVFVRRFASRGQRGWMIYSLSTGVATPVLIAFGMGSILESGVAFFIADVVVCAWVVAVTTRLLTDITLEKKEN
jgi:hypothetical membrane protein